MKNISKDTLQNIAQETAQLVDSINQGIKWTDQYLKDELQVDTSYKLKSYRRKLNKIKRAITTKPVIALFGASQVGKSYLVKNILSDQDNKLQITDHRDTNKQFNFIQEINPEGQGKESTSVVTRFTFEPNQDASQLPVKIKLISPKDLIVILTDSYLADIRKKKLDIKKEDISVLLEELPKLYAPHAQSFLTEDDIYDIQDYLEQFFEASFKGRLEALRDAAYWHTVAGNMHKIPVHNWEKVFSLLWGKQPKLSQLFEMLIDELAKMQFPSIVHSDFDAVLRKAGTILDVKRLSELYTQQSDKVGLQIAPNKRHLIPRSTLCALSSEVILNISKASVEAHPFINNTDILDFPGARTRLKLDETDNGVTEEQLPDMLLRGKVAYLFNSYSLNYEINNLFVCTHSKQHNVRDLPELVNNWISYNIGESPEERYNTLKNFAKPPLFIIFTWWNMQLDYDQDNDEVTNGMVDPLEYKWKLRFDALFNEEVVGTYHWDKNWTSAGPFRNYFLLRDYKYSRDVFDGFEQSGQETLLKESRTNYYQRLKSSFEQSQLVNTLFDNPAKVWEETSTVGKDGSDFIIENLQQVASNQIRTTRYLEIIKSAKKDLLKELDVHFHSDKSDEQIRKASEEGSEIHAIMNKVFGDAYNFGHFLELLTISEQEIYEFFHNRLRDKNLLAKTNTNEYVLFKESSPDLNTENSFEENLEVLRKTYNHPDTDFTRAYFEDKLQIDLEDLFYGELNNLKNKSIALAEEARDYWYDENLDLEKFSFFIDQGIEKRLLQRLFDSLRLNFDKLQLVDKMASYIRRYVDRVNRVDVAENMIAHTTAGVINKFVNSVGWDYYSKIEKEKLRETNEVNQLNLYFPDEEVSFDVMDKSVITGLFDFMENFVENVNKRPLDTDTLYKVPMIKSYRKWRELMRIAFIANCNIPTYNVEANRLLGELIEEIKLYNFSL